MLLVLVLMGTCMLFVVWLAGESGPRGQDAENPLAASADRISPGAEDPADPSLEMELDAVAVAPDARDPIESVAILPGARMFQITLRLENPDGRDFEGHWQLDVERVGTASEHDPIDAVEGLGASYTLTTLVRATYDVRARSGALVSPWSRAIAADAQHAATVRLVLDSTSRIRGEVVESTLAPCADLEIFLVARPGEHVTTTRTDANGAFALDGLAPGLYELVLGGRLSPLVPEQVVELRGTETVLDRIVLPPLFDLPLRVVDTFNRPVANASVSSGARKGGTFDLRTDADGRATGRRLVAGRLRVFAACDGFERVNQHVVVPLASGTALEIVLPQIGAKAR